MITDRRAGRIPTEESRLLCRELDKIQVAGVGVEVHAVRDHRFAVIFHGEDLSEDITETDPQTKASSPLPVRALNPDAQHTAIAVNWFVESSRKALDGRSSANMIMLRGFSKRPDLPSMSQVYKLKPAAIATYPMYRGIARLLGMEVLETGATFQDEVETLRERYSDYDFFYLHFKGADTAGEDGDFDTKVQALEELDRGLPHLIALQPEVLVVAGDHSTPATFAAHSWHPVPFLLKSRWGRKDDAAEFTERACAGGILGRFPATEIMPSVLAYAEKLVKYGA